MKSIRIIICLMMALSLFGVFSAFAQDGDDIEKAKEKQWDNLLDELLNGTTYNRKITCEKIGALRDSRPLIQAPWSFTEKLLNILNDPKEDVRVRRASGDSITRLMELQDVKDKMKTKIMAGVEKAFKDVRNHVSLRSSLAFTLSKLINPGDPTHLKSIGLLKAEFKSPNGEISLKGSCLVALAEIGENIQNDAKAALQRERELSDYAVEGLRIMQSKGTLKPDVALVVPLMSYVGADIDPNRLIDICIILGEIIDGGQTRAEQVYDKMSAMAETCVSKEYDKAFQYVINLMGKSEFNKTKFMEYVIKKAENEDGKVNDKIRSRCIDQLGERLQKMTQNPADCSLSKKVMACLIKVLRDEKSIQLKLNAAFSIGSTAEKDWIDRRDAAKALHEFLLDGNDDMAKAARQQFSLITGLDAEGLSRIHVKDLRVKLVEEWGKWLEKRENMDKLRGRC